MEDVQLPHLKILFPTVPDHPYTPLGGEVKENVTGKIILRRLGPSSNPILVVRHLVLCLYKKIFTKKVSEF
jgi:hypothetical protein